jgi:hypothetical protein
MATIKSWSADTFAALADNGALYPMVGQEWLLLIIVVVFWLWWHYRTSAGETEELDRVKSENAGKDAYKQYKSEW